jgi:glycosyltransferase involved in cell wall biosynthesis
VRILQVITDTDRRGAQMFATDLGDALARRGHEVSTVAMVAGRADSTLAVPVLGTSRRSPRLYLELARAARRADVVIAHGSSTLVSCAISVWRVPFVYRQISDPVFWAGRASRRHRVAAYLRRATHVVALSATTRRQLGELFGLSSDRMTVIPNGIDPTRLGAGESTRSEAPEGGRLRLLTVNALVPEKGTDLVVEAVARRDDVELTVVGDGPERRRLEGLAEDRGATHRITFVGQVDSVAPYFADADVVVLASRDGDSMPATLIEAGFVGVPAISTDVGSITDIVVDGRTGRIVDLSRDGSLDEAIEEMTDESTRARYAAAARSHCAEVFHIDVVAAAWDSVVTHV